MAEKSHLIFNHGKCFPLASIKSIKISRTLTSGFDQESEFSKQSGLIKKSGFCKQSEITKYSGYSKSSGLKESGFDEES